MAPGTWPVASTMAPTSTVRVVAMAPRAMAPNGQASAQARHSAPEAGDAPTQVRRQALASMAETCGRLPG